MTSFRFSGQFTAQSLIAVTNGLARKLDALMRFCNAFFLFSTPRTAKGLVGHANDLVHVYCASIFGWLGTLVASPLVYVEVTVGLRRTLS